MQSNNVEVFFADMVFVGSTEGVAAGRWISPLRHVTGEMSGLS
jgi:hypothetical protein